METKQFKVKAVTPSFWEVTFINPPIKLIDAETIQQLNGLLADIEADPKLTIVVFKSDDPDFFMAHYDAINVDLSGPIVASHTATIIQIPIAQPYC
jgi:enoyl-CoA hydratase/carnithine racemase